MRVLLQHGYYPEHGSRDEWEIVEYYEKYLARSGVDVDVCNGGCADPCGYDIVHLFGLSAEGYQLSRAAADARVPVLATPLYWNDDYPIHYDLRRTPPPGEDPALRERSLSMKYFEKMMLLSRVRQEKYILESATLIFVSGRCEKMMLTRDFTLPGNKIIMAPVGVDLAMGAGRAEMFREKYGLSGFALCVGPIIKRKNQHQLIEITREKKLPLVLIGAGNGGENEYADYCRDIAHRNTHFFDELDPALLRSAYHAASVFVMPSLCELPGVPCLSAALAGCPVVVSERGTAWDYLGADASYCDPEDYHSIADAMDRAIAARPDGALKKNLLDHFSWGKVILLVSKIYRKVHSLKK